MAPVTPKITLSTPCRGCSPWAGTGGRDRDCSISWAWCGTLPRRRGRRRPAQARAARRRPRRDRCGIGYRWTRNALPVRFSTKHGDIARVVVQVVGARAVVRATGPDRYGGSRSSAQRLTVVEVGCADQAGERVPCSGRDTRHAGAADRLGSSTGARRRRPPPPAPVRVGADDRLAVPRAPRRPRSSGEHREDVLRGSASSLPRAVPPVHRPLRRRRRRRRQPEGWRRQDDLGGEPGRGVRRAGQAGPARRPRRPGLPDLLASGSTPTRWRRRSTRCSSARRRSRTPSSRARTGLDLVPLGDRARRRRGAAAATPGPRVRPADRAGDGWSTTTTSSCSTARRRLGVLTLNALTAANGLVIPMPCEMLSHRGVGPAARHRRRRAAHPQPWSARSSGILPTMFDGRSNHAQAVLADVGERYDLPVLVAADPEDGPLRRGPGGRSLDPVDLARPRAPQAYREVAAALLATR